MTMYGAHLKNSKTMIGMVHVHALPGTPRNTLSPQKILELAITEAWQLKNAGFDALLIENMHDTPYLKTQISHEISCLMGVIGYEIKKQTQLPVGIQILAAANKQALAAALAANLDFIRAEGFVYGHLADEGFIESCAGDLLRYRKQIGAEHISIFTDIKKKHASHAMSADVSIDETAEAAEFFLSDAIIVTGNTTGSQASLLELNAVNEVTKLPIIVGSGITIENISDYILAADAFIVGSSIKKLGKWFNEIDEDYAHNFMQKVKNLRTK